MSSTDNMTKTELINDIWRMDELIKNLWDCPKPFTNYYDWIKEHERIDLKELIVIWNDYEYALNNVNSIFNRNKTKN